MELINQFTQWGASTFGSALWTVIWALIRIVPLMVVVLLSVAYLTYAERKVIGAMQGRVGPQVVGPFGLLQPIADVVKLLVKEIITPTRADKPLYYLGPLMVLVPAFAVWAVIPLAKDFVIANVDASLLYVMSIASIGVYGVILAGWATNSKYAFFGAMRASAQMVSYEIAMGFAIVVVLMISNSLNLTTIVEVQQKGMFNNMGLNFLSWNWLPLLPMFLVYLISGVAETNRHPFDVVEGESEIVAGHMTEYSGMGFALFFLAEYTNMFVISALTSIMFLGGWDAPVAFLSFIPGIVWMLIKMSAVIVFFLWIRATFPRYRYDQIMRLGWKVFLPLCLIWLFVVGVWLHTPLSIWK
ncbi:MAG: NADH-quinone oxidoreductase subunit NuoH [Burkholderiales bacterium]|jgi:NADH-quinone oxidoreductase subunit H|nr:NADH-quinone oxidoreductase subunit NuoH [Burkholderiales bacterium]MCE1176210.1 NADH-quinone oxidoreductase subunit NuoH [Burkholderiales bacterium]